MFVVGLLIIMVKIILRERGFSTSVLCRMKLVVK